MECPICKSVFSKVKEVLKPACLPQAGTFSSSQLEIGSLYNLDLELFGLA